MTYALYRFVFRTLLLLACASLFAWSFVRRCDDSTELLEQFPAPTLDEGEVPSAPSDEDLDALIEAHKKDSQ